MRRFFSINVISFFVFLIFLALPKAVVFSSTGTIDPDDEGYKYAKILDNDSGINFKCTNCNVSVDDSSLNGYVWSEDFGWINLSPSLSGVINDGEGVLSGYAWGENTGWINFNPTNGGVDINSDGFFSGHAWGENTGWIVFDCSDLVNSCVYTDWRKPRGGPPGGGSSPKKCEDGLDNDKDGFVDFPEDLGCEELNDNSEVLIGCADQSADNFSSQVNEHQGDSCQYSPILGCTNQNALNYNPIAEIENNSCLFSGCTNPNAINYDSTVDINDGSCTFPPPPISPDKEGGCLDVLAINYNQNFDFDDGSCVYPPILIFGCTDSTATNYNAEADSDNGSCVFKIDPLGVGKAEETGGKRPNPFKNSNTLIVLSVISFLIGRGGAISRVVASPIRLLNSIPSILGFRRKKRPWGTVYDSITKQPLDPAYVELNNLDGGVSSTSITDIDGRYGFLVSSGKYTLKVGKKDYIFPSVKLEGKSKDSFYDNLYFGGTINKKDDDEIIAKNIPMDPIGFNWNEFEKSKNKELLKFYSRTELFISEVSEVIFFAGFIFSLLATYLNPSSFNIIVLIVYVFILGISFWGIKPRPPGFLIKKKSGQPISFGVVRLFSSSLKREVSHCVASETGRYFLLTPNGQYFITIEEKIGEDKYREIFKSDDFEVKKGFVNKKIRI